MKFAKSLMIGSLLLFILLNACSQATPVATQASSTAEPTLVTATATPAWSGALPTFHGNLDHTGIYNSPPIRKLKGVKWKFRLEGNKSYITTSPALANGFLYFGGSDGNLYALDIESGAELWRFHTEGPVHSSPAVSNGIVYFQSNDGFTYALDGQSGKQKWKVDTGPNRLIDYDFLSSSPAVQGNTVFIAGGNGNLYALNADTGEALWVIPAIREKPVRSSPAVDGDTVYFTREDKLLALDTQTGKEKWSFEAFTLARSSPAIGEGVIIFGDNASTIFAVDSRTGTKKWEYSIKYYWVVSTAAISDGVVYIGGDDSYLNALNAQTGEVLWRFKTRGETIWSSPAVVGGVIYAGDWNYSNAKDENGNTLWGYMYAIDAQTGRELWNYKTGGNIVSSPVVDARGVLYFGSLDGCLYALEGQE